ncbi:hypothetical protein LTR95_004520 [Oleoguttula sp. CCFEE 5521]
MLQHQPAANHPLHHHLLQQQYSQHQTYQQPQHVYAPQVAYYDPALFTPGYRPLQLPVHRHDSIKSDRQQHHIALAQQQQQQAAGLYAQTSRPVVYHQRPVSSQQVAQHHQRLQHRTMAAPAHQMTDEELAQMQQASAEWQPEIEGPLVGQRETTSNITAEYARADPVYQVKTAALPQKYSHYRTVRGDGRCGWRAIAFGYLERLLYIGDSGRVLMEEARLRSLNNVVASTGIDMFLVEDFAEEWFQLMRKLSIAVDQGNGDEVLAEAFADENVQNCLITHLRTLTTAWMLTRSENYLGYMVGQTVEQYTNEHITPHGAEIDHLGMSALQDLLLNPAGFALEVMYLDRSEGNEANMHRFDPLNGITEATIRLLYRPGHYDLLYKLEDVPPPATPIATYLQFSSSLYHDPGQLSSQCADFQNIPDFITTIPGMSFAQPHPGWMTSNGCGADFLTPGTSHQAYAPPVAPAPQPQIQPHAVIQPPYVPTTPSSLSVTPPEYHTHGLAIRTVPHVNYAAMHAPPMQTPSFSSDGPFRPSMWERYPHVQATSGSTFQTSIMRNSHFNTAHFLNADFQPEEWKPDDEYETTAPITSKGRHKSFG